jgi:multicomponent K+:H+ antiporter subunit E
MRQVATRAFRRLPPALIGGLVIIWLLLSQSIGVGSIVLGIVLAVALAWAGATLRPVRPRLRRPLAAFGLLATVMLDVLRSNFAVARIVVGLVRDRQVTSGFLDVPLDLRDPHALTALAAIITSTPGTVWVGLSADGGTLRLHVLDLRDPDEWIHAIKTRYEQPLMRIFE